MNRELTAWCILIHLHCLCHTDQDWVWTESGEADIRLAAPFQSFQGWSPDSLKRPITSRYRSRNDSWARQSSPVCLWDSLLTGLLCAECTTTCSRLSARQSKNAYHAEPQTPSDISRLSTTSAQYGYSVALWLQEARLTLLWDKQAVMRDFPVKFLQLSTPKWKRKGHFAELIMTLTPNWANMIRYTLLNKQKDLTGFFKEQSLLIPNRILHWKVLSRLVF